MCIVEDTPNDPQQPHSDSVEPGRHGEGASVDQLIRNLKYFWFILIPLLVWSIRVEGFMQKGDRQTSAMALEQHAAMVTQFEQRLDTLPPQLYRDYVDLQFKALNERLDKIEKLLENQ